jgi:hypothetical protein
MTDLREGYLALNARHAGENQRGAKKTQRTGRYCEGSNRA